MRAFVVTAFATCLSLACAAGAGAQEAASPATSPAVATPAAAADAMDQMVCRKSKETGSLVKAHKQCHTRRQWAYLDEINQGYSRQMVDDTRTRPGSQ